MTKVTELSAGGALQHDQLEQSEDWKEEQNKKPKVAGLKGKKKKMKTRKAVIPDRKTLHEAHHFLVQTYVEGNDVSSSESSDE